MDFQQKSQGDDQQKNPLKNYSDPKKIGVSAIICAFVSLFIFGSGLSLMAMIYGSYGIYHAAKKKSGIGIMLLNIAAVVLDLINKILLAMATRKS